MEDHAYTYELAESEGLKALDDDERIALQRELIYLVQNEPFLYDKKVDGHMDKDLIANTWDAIGLSLSKPMSGEEACKEFYKLRQRFGKEKRKVRRSNIRADAGAGSTYVPNWILYKDLEFLSDHIQARIRSSTNGVSSFPQTTAQFVPEVVRKSLLIPSTTTNGLSAAAAAVSPNDPLNIAERMSVPGPSRVNGVTSRDSTPTSSISVSGSMKNDPIRKVDFGTMEVCSDSSSSPTRVIRLPETEHPYKRRRRESDAFNRTLLECSKAIKELVENVCASLQKSSSHEAKRNSVCVGWEKFSPNLQAILTSLGFAFTKIRDEDHLSCLIDILNIINTKYIKKSE